jgi:hypothetical protein
VFSEQDQAAVRGEHNPVSGNIAEDGQSLPEEFVAMCDTFELNFSGVLQRGRQTRGAIGPPKAPAREPEEFSASFRFREAARLL